NLDLSGYLQSRCGHLSLGSQPGVRVRGLRSHPLSQDGGFPLPVYGTREWHCERHHRGEGCLLGHSLKGFRRKVSTSGALRPGTIVTDPTMPSTCASTELSAASRK